MKECLHTREMSEANSSSLLSGENPLNLAASEKEVRRSWWTRVLVSLVSRFHVTRSPS